MVAHISESNNSRQRAEEALLTVLDSLEDVVWADQGEGFDWLPVLRHLPAAARVEVPE